MTEIIQTVINLFLLGILVYFFWEMHKVKVIMVSMYRDLVNIKEKGFSDDKETHEKNPWSKTKRN